MNIEGLLEIRSEQNVPVHDEEVVPVLGEKSSRGMKRAGRIWIRVFPDVPITQKPLEVRMGSGKGNVEYWVAKVKPGKVLFEMEGVDEKTAREAFRLAGAKLSVTTSFVKRQVR